MRVVLAGFLALALGAVGGVSVANAASIDGSWHGEGTVKLASGEAEKVRCRIRYQESTGRTFIINVTCAHTHGIFEQSGRIVQVSGSQYSGRLYSNQYGVAGDVRISVNGSRQTITAKSPKGSARITLTKQ